MSRHCEPPQSAGVDEGFDLLTRHHPGAFTFLAQLQSRYPIGMPITLPDRSAKKDFGISGKTQRHHIRILQEHRRLACLHQGGQYSPAIAKSNPSLPDRGDVAWYVLLPVGLNKAS